LIGCAEATSAAVGILRKLPADSKFSIKNGFKLGAAARLAVPNGRTVLLAAQILGANFVY
jgi:hypothetical protein